MTWKIAGRLSVVGKVRLAASKIIDTALFNLFLTVTGRFKYMIKEYVNFGTVINRCCHGDSEREETAVFSGCHGEGYDRYSNFSGQ